MGGDGGGCESTDMSLRFGVGDDTNGLSSYECRMRCLAAPGCVGFNNNKFNNKCYLKKGTLDLDTCDAPKNDMDMYRLCKLKFL